MYRAVVFDLWMTLVRPPEQAFDQLRRAWSERLGVGTDELDAIWLDAEGYRRRETGPIRAAIAEVGERLKVDVDVEATLAARLDFMREVLVPDEGVVSTLTELRERGVATALVSNSTEDVALVWNETPFVGLFDAAAFSATAGFMKPEREIYELVLSELAVPASAALFVGDGANDELDGARRVGMTPVLLDDPGAQHRPHADGWTGLRITAIPQVLDLVP
jgi:putative hydrolase of the HAD superfamily